MKKSDLDKLSAELEGRMPLRESLVLFAIVAAISSIILWAILSEVDDVTRASGRVVPNGDIQQIQSPAEGVIRSVFVSEGDFIEAGSVILEFDALVQNSKLDREIQKSLAFQATIERLTAEIEQEELVFSKALDTAPSDLLNSEMSLFKARKVELQGEINVLESRLEQRARERDEILSDLEGSKEALELWSEQENIVRPLVEKGIESRLSLINISRAKREHTSRINRSEASLRRLDMAEAEVVETIMATENRFKREALRDLSKATGELASLRPSLPALENLADRATIRSPVRGVVNQLYRKTVGGAVRLGEDIAEIVPLDEDVKVEAHIMPTDIAFIRVGQPVRVKLTAYDFTRYGALDGTITRIGANAVQIEQRDSGEVFIASVKTTGAIFDADGERVQIIPGMTAEIDILAGKSKVIDYLLQPIERMRQRAFQE